MPTARSKLDFLPFCRSCISSSLISQYFTTTFELVGLTNYRKSRIFRTHSVFVSWALRPFVRMTFLYSCWPLRILWLALYLLHAFYFRTEAAVYEIYENNMPTKYSGLTVVLTNVKGEIGEGRVPVVRLRQMRKYLTPWWEFKPERNPHLLLLNLHQLSYSKFAFRRMQNYGARLGCS